MKQKAGIAIFLFGVLWSMVWGIGVSVSSAAAINSMTLEQLNESVWALGGSMMMLWGIGGVPLGTVIAGIGLLMYTNAKGLTTLFFALGVLLAIFLAMFSGGS